MRCARPRRATHAAPLQLHEAVLLAMRVAQESSVALTPVLVRMQLKRNTPPVLTGLIVPQYSLHAFKFMFLLGCDSYRRGACLLQHTRPSTGLVAPSNEPALEMPTASFAENTDRSDGFGWKYVIRVRCTGDTMMQFMLAVTSFCAAPQTVSDAGYVAGVLRGQ